MGIYRGGIIDKTLMNEADSRTSLHDFSIWALYFNLILEKLRQLPCLDFSRE
jgi:methyl coenzyme M reductase beta subunit